MKVVQDGFARALMYLTRTAGSSLNFTKLCLRAFSVAKWLSIKQSLRHGARYFQ